MELMLFAIGVGVIALVLAKGRSTNVTLLEYQSAVLYRRGLPTKEVRSGRYRVWIRREKLIIVDNRPIQVSLENQTVLLKDGQLAVYGLSGTARVQDTRKVIYCAQNYNQMPAFVFVCCTRAVLNGFTAAQLHAVKDSAVEEIVKRSTARLTAAGFELLALRLTQLSVRPPSPAGPTI